MNRVRHSVFARSFLLPLALLLWLGGCYHYVPVPRPYERTIEDHGKVRITLSDSSSVRMFSPRLEDESVVGESGVNRGQLLTLPLEDVARIEAEKTDPTIPMLIALGIAGALAIALLSCDDCLWSE